MSFDSGKMATFAAKSIDDLEEVFGDHPGAELGEIVIVVEIKNIPDPDSTGDTEQMGTAVRYSCTDDRFWVAKGLLVSAVDSI